MTNPEHFRRPWQLAADEQRWNDAIFLWIAEKRADGTFVQMLPHYETQRALLALARYYGARE